MRNVTLILNDGSRFHGKSFGYEKPVAGEVVFNTAMTGYPESLRKVTVLFSYLQEISRIFKGKKVKR